MDVEQKEEVVSDQEFETKKENFCNKQLSKILILTVIIVAIILAILFKEETVKILSSFLDWVETHKFLGPICLCLIYIICVVFFIPGSILTIGAGLAFKQAYGTTWKAMIVGFLSVWIGASVGATIAMLLGRFVFKEFVTKLSMKYPLIKAIDKAIDTEGLKLIILLRLCPLIPFNAMNYLMGITSIQTRHYIIGNTGMIPGTLTYVFIGTTISDIADAVQGKNDQGTLIFVLLIVGSILACIGIIQVSIVAKRYLNELIKQQQ